MKAMQDKDFDAFFADKLGEMEEMPSAEVWSGISAHIQPKPKKKFPWLAVAASVLVLITAGVFVFRNAEEKPKEIARVEPMVKERSVVEPKVQPDEPVSPLKTAHEAVRVAENSGRRSAPFRKPAQQKNRSEKGMDANPVSEERGVQLAAAQTQPLNLGMHENAVQPVTHKTINTESAVIKEVLASRMEKKHPVNNLGDLVNLVVAKVDKRADKVIEFRDEDGQATVSSVNLGLITIKK
ncbi:MAG: hypothetical protein INR69_00195 [Mucilaginibacter polytrichastri]|nr:hypothetical protein [Mucilaginibacter polytrichastri]